MEKCDYDTEEVPVVSVQTTYGRLKYKNITEDEALSLYASAKGWDMEFLKHLNPKVTREKVTRPCLKKSESMNSETFSNKRQESPHTRKVKK